MLSACAALVVRSGYLVHDLGRLAAAGPPFGQRRDEWGGLGLVELEIRRLVQSLDLEDRAVQAVPQNASAGRLLWHMTRRDIRVGDLDFDVVRCAALAPDGIGDLRTARAAGSNLNATNREGLTALWWHSAQSNWRAVQNLLRARAVVDFPRHRRGQPSVVALCVEGAAHARARNLGPNERRPPRADTERTVEALVRGGADPDRRNRRGMAGLHIAADRGSVWLVRLLLRCGANADARTPLGWTALRISAEASAVGVMRALLGAGAGADCEDVHGVTPLMACAMAPPFAAFMPPDKPALACIGAVLAAGADTRRVDLSGNTALMHAIRCDRPLVDLLVRAGSPLRAVRSPLSPPLRDGNGYPVYDPLLVAVKRTNAGTCRTTPSIVRSLLRAGADAGALDSRGGSVLMAWLRVRPGDTPDCGLTELLLASGCDVNARDCHDGSTALSIAVTAPWYRSCPIVLRLLEAGAHANARDRQRCTPLMLAAGREGTAAIIQQLLRHGADVDTVNHVGWTPLMVAVDRRDLRNTRLLLASGADARARDGCGWSTLMLAARAGGTEAVELIHVLLEHRAEITPRCRQGFSALHIAADANNGGAIEALVREGACVSATSEDGETPLARAVIGRSTCAVNALLPPDGAMWQSQSGTPPADIPDRPWGRTPLMHAAARGYTYIAGLLVQRGARTDLRDRNGQTAREIALCNGYTRTARAVSPRYFH